MHVIEVFEVIGMFVVLFLRMSQKLIALVLKLCLWIMKGLIKLEYLKDVNLSLFDVLLFKYNSWISLKFL